MKIPTIINLDPVKAGWYDACVLLAEVRRTSTRCELEVTYLITEECKENDRTVRESFILFDMYSDKIIVDSCDKLVEMATACGVEHILEDTEQLLNRDLRIKVGTKTIDGKKKNIVKEYAPITK